jgi:hypothetical protein
VTPPQFFVVVVLFVCLFVCFGTGTETQGLHLEQLQGVMGFFEMGGSHKLFAPAGFEPQSS